jgi:hypothetical protein
MDLLDIRKVEIIYTDPESSEPEGELNEYLKAGWVLLSIYNRDIGENFPSQSPCFVIGWPRELLRRPKPQTETQDSLGRS